MIVEQALLMLRSQPSVTRRAARTKLAPRRQTKKLRGGSKVGVAPPCSVEPFHFELRAAWRSSGVIVRRVASSRAMDFKGQYYCERLFQILVVIFGAIGFVVGYLQQDFRITFYFLATGGGISAVVRAAPTAARSRSLSLRAFSKIGLPYRAMFCFALAGSGSFSLYAHPSRSLFFNCCASQICLPDWPWWNRHPLEWLEVVEEEEPPPKEKKKKKDKEKAEGGEKKKEKVK